MKKKAVIVSGYFNPIHKGHLEYFNNAKAVKGSKEFQGEEERMTIVSNIKAVDYAILSVDKDRTVCATLENIAEEYGHSHDLAFANGGDQNNDTIPERPTCEKVGIALIDGLGDKIQSSSWLLKKL
jgi:glycerol-3-phosphate cytidylyltransferase-like family protein